MRDVVYRFRYPMSAREAGANHAEVSFSLLLLNTNATTISVGLEVPQMNIVLDTHSSRVRFTIFDDSMDTWT